MKKMHLFLGIFSALVANAWGQSDILLRHCLDMPRHYPLTPFLPALKDPLLYKLWHSNLAKEWNGNSSLKDARIIFVGDYATRKDTYNEKTASAIINVIAQKDDLVLVPSQQYYTQQELKKDPANFLNNGNLSLPFYNWQESSYIQDEFDTIIGQIKKTEMQKSTPKRLSQIKELCNKVANVLLEKNEGLEKELKYMLLVYPNRRIIVVGEPRQFTHQLLKKFSNYNYVVLIPELETKNLTLLELIEKERTTTRALERAKASLIFGKELPKTESSRFFPEEIHTTPSIQELHNKIAQLQELKAQLEKSIALLEGKIL